MTQEQKELLLKNLCARLPYGVVVNVKGFDYDYNSKLTQIYNGVGCSIQVTTNMPYDIEQVKPYLFPLSSMTVGQGQEFAATLKYLPAEEIDFWTLNTFDWCNKNHFDYRNLIGKGLAIDATRKNIY